MSLKTSRAFDDARRANPQFIKPKTGNVHQCGASLYIPITDENIDALASRDSALPSGQKPKIGETKPIPCPCCSQPVVIPTVELAIDFYHLTPLEGKILRAVWRGKGYPVMTDRIFDAMYEDDPDGGPSASRMYAAFKVALCHLRERLSGSGISIENVGYRQGYRLVIGAN